MIKKVYQYGETVLVLVSLGIVVGCIAQLV